MPSLKLITVSSIYANKPNHLNKWVRTITPTTTTRARTPTYSVAWRISSCAPLLPPAHHKLFSFYTNHGFRVGQKCIYTSEHKVVGHDVVSDMGDENKDHHHDVTPTSPLPPTTSPFKDPQSSKLLTLPTILTIGRVAAVPLLISTFYVDGWWGTTATTGIFIAAAITDWLDGYLARKMKLGTAFGAFLDPVADKLMVAATLVLLCTRPFEVATFGQVPWLLAVPSISIIGREITMSAVREWAASQNNKLSEAVAVNNLGKWKTATQMTALTILLATRDSSLTWAGVGTLVATGVVLLYISAWLALWSLIVYMRKIWKVLLC